ncbi:MAG: hypothetical protein E7G14_05190 [Klebsiella michiganensis]|nr:hypothetical protein [Klebsiella michiganensis]MDU3715206.1 hypothetical protein [Klebsiella michiganensis]
MTITLQAVNELIQSLESAGELSLKETKVMALAKAYQQLAAENVGLTSGFSFFMHSPDAGFETYKTRDEAINAANEMIDEYRGDAGDGWPEEVEQTVWGVIIQHAVQCDIKNPSEENRWEGSCDYKLLPETPATDRIVAGIKADEAKFIFQSILDNPAVADLGSLVDWLEQHANDSAAAVRAMREGAK